MTKVSPEVLALFTKHDWPGNVRELENVIYRSAVIAQGDAILVKDLPAELGGSALTQSSNPPFSGDQPADSPSSLTVEAALDFLHRELSAGDEPILAFIQKGIAERTLKELDGNETATAKQLGLTKPALKKLLG